MRPTSARVRGEVRGGVASSATRRRRPIVDNGNTEARAPGVETGIARWRQLERDLREQHLRLPAEEAEPVVVSIWIVRRGERAPRFVTAFPGDGP